MCSAPASERLPKKKSVPCAPRGCATNWSAARNAAATAWSAVCVPNCCWLPIPSQISKAAARRFASTLTCSAYRSSSTIPASKPRATDCLPISCAPCASKSLTCASAIRNRPLRSHAVRVADIEQHSFRNFSGHFARFQVENKQGLAALHFAWIGALFPDSSQNRARVISEIHDELHQFFGAGHFFHALDGAHANVERFQG